MWFIHSPGIFELEPADITAKSQMSHSKTSPSQNGTFVIICGHFQADTCTAPLITVTPQSSQGDISPDGMVAHVPGSILDAMAR
jgi:hypothetical protein